MALKKTDELERETKEESLAEEQMPLEEMFGQMESIIDRMETEDVSLEESFRLYSEGMRLLKKCNETIDTVEKKVLVLDENGETYEF